MCGSLDVADSRLVLQNWEQFAVEGSWLHTAICPRQAVVFLNTDQVQTTNHPSDVPCVCVWGGGGEGMNF